MDNSESAYENVDGGSLIHWNRGAGNLSGINANNDTCSSPVQSEGTVRVENSVSTVSERSPYKAATVCLGLLCVLLLAGIIGLALSYNSLLDPNNLLLTRERDLLKTINNNLTRERDQLKSERDNLKIILRNYKDGWTGFSSSFYYVSTEEKTWEESRQDCRRRGADLVVINSREEMEFVHNATKKRFWMGLTNNVTTREWTWLDGTPVKQAYWNEGEPNLPDSHGPGCVERWKPDNSAVESWADASCDLKVFYVCEK